MTYAQVRDAYQSWRGYAGQKDAYKTIRRMDILFNRLFIKEWVYVPQIPEYSEERRIAA